MDPGRAGRLQARLEGARGPPGRQPGDAGDGMVATHLCVPLPGEDDRKGWRARLRKGKLGLGGPGKWASFPFLFFCLIFPFLIYFSAISLAT